MLLTNTHNMNKRHTVNQEIHLPEQLSVKSIQQDKWYVISYNNATLQLQQAIK